jgi:hypothetical protein
MSLSSSCPASWRGKNRLMLRGMERFPAAVLFADVSGFTTLADRLAQRGPAGAEALVRQLPPDYLRRLTNAFQQAGVASSRRGRRGAVPGLVEPLSERELQVLGLLAAGRSNQQIADELVVALDTVKSTSATSSTSSGRPTAPRRWPAPGTCGCSGKSARSAPSMARWCIPGGHPGWRGSTSNAHLRVMAPPRRVGSVLPKHLPDHTP